MDGVCLIQAAELLQGDCLLLISKSPEIPETHRPRKDEGLSRQWFNGFKPEAHELLIHIHYARRPIHYAMAQETIHVILLVPLSNPKQQPDRNQPIY